MAAGYRQQMPTEFQFFADCWNFYGRFYEASNSDRYWEAVVNESAEINERYKSPLCKDLLVAIMKELQRKGETVADERVQIYIGTDQKDA